MNDKQVNQPARLSEPPASYDDPWKQGLEQYFEPLAKLIDYEARWQELDQSQNPFVAIIMAHLKTKATTGLPQQRKQWKWILVRKLFEQGYSRNDVVQLFRLIDWMMTLPADLEQEFRTQVRQYQEERQMPFLSRMELMAKEEGVQEGIEVGKLQTLRETILDVLNLRFASVSETVVELLNRLEDAAILKRLHLRSIVIASIDEFQKLLLEQINILEQANGENESEAQRS